MRIHALLVLPALLLAACSQPATVTGHAHFGWEWSCIRPQGKSEAYWIEAIGPAATKLDAQLKTLLPESDDPQRMPFAATL